MNRAASRAFDLYVDVPVWIVAAISVYTVMFWTAIAVRRYDRTHPPIKEVHPEQ